MMQWKKALCAASASALAALGGLYGLYRYAFYSPRGAQNDDHHISPNPQMQVYREQIGRAIDALNALPYERVYITSADGLRLTGRYYPAKPGAPLVIACHGYRGTPLRDFSVGAELYRSMGCALLLIEERGQCGSAGHTITFGAMEKYDVLLWTRWAADRFGDIPILLGGISMGAATVLMASALALPENVRGIVADCPYTNAKDIICSVAQGMVIPAAWLYPFAWLSAKIFGHADLAQADALSAVRYARLPILLIHGEDDRFVPCDMSRENCAHCRCAEKELLKDALTKLSERERKIMFLRFGLSGGEEMTQKDVADLLGISQSYISRLEKKIIQRLKKEITKMV